MNRQLIRHYVEMVAAMGLGMVVLGAAGAGLLSLVGVEVSSWETEAPALALLGMAFTMSAPMAGWMRYRGHGWAPAAEMTAAMFVPSFAAIGLLWSGAVTDFHTLMGIEHATMFPGMFAVMLMRRDEYARPSGRAPATA